MYGGRPAVNVSKICTGLSPEFVMNRIQNIELKAHCDRSYMQLPRPGNGGVDLFGNYEGFLILVQCKNRRRNIGPEILRDLEGVLSRYHNGTTIGILVVPFKENYTSGTIRRARTSRYNIILTDVRYLYLDLVQFAEERSCSVH
ncbi:1959_t:CDS:2 [Funneliformis mosseae]|uniref:1959_t:CDS:1 n=1 Tax=Funneliformis mosseae TaxID=27381 RepID=A0A9N9CFL9_FUNMO|nr:1959_t:CDS:2 [Funneliformis mosseae]